MHIVEVRRDGDALAGLMAEMRDWLDAHRIAPKLFTMSVASKRIVFRLEFDNASGATAFAVAFDGRVLGREIPRAA